MDFFEFATFATGVGCLTAVILRIVNATLGGKNKQRESALQLALERGDQQERRIAELTRQNEQLHDQLEWHNRLLSSYERALGEPASRNGDDRLPTAPARHRN